MKHDEELEALLQQARQEFTPDEARAKRVYNAVLGSTGALLGASAVVHGLTSGSKAAAATATASKVGLAGQVLGAVGAKAWVVGAMALAGVSSGVGVYWLHLQPDGRQQAVELSRVANAAPPKFGSPPPGARADEALLADDVAAEDTAAEVSVDDASASPDETSTDEASTEDGVEEAERAPLPVRADVETAAPPKKQVSGDSGPPPTLRDELGAVRSAEQALHGGDPIRALAALDGFGERGGHMRQERDALRVLAHCQIGSAGAAERAERFLRQYGTTLYSARIRAACHLDPALD